MEKPRRCFVGLAREHACRYVTELLGCHTTTNVSGIKGDGWIPQCSRDEFPLKSESERRQTGLCAVLCTDAEEEGGPVPCVKKAGIPNFNWEVWNCKT
jgi:hypothetical protein